MCVYLCVNSSRSNDETKEFVEWTLRAIYRFFEILWIEEKEESIGFFRYLEAIVIQL